MVTAFCRLYLTRKGAVPSSSSETKLDIEIKIYNMTGALVFEGKDKRIDISEFPNGVYNLAIIYNKILLNKRIIKQ